MPAATTTFRSEDCVPTSAAGSPAPSAVLASWVDAMTSQAPMSALSRSRAGGSRILNRRELIPTCFDPTAFRIEPLGTPAPGGYDARTVDGGRRGAGELRRRRHLAHRAGGVLGPVGAVPRVGAAHHVP